MALINDVIKKYEAEARQRIEEARKLKQKDAGSREEIFLKVSSPSPQIIDDTPHNGSIWKARPIKVKPRSEQQTQQAQIQATQEMSNEEFQAEIERLKKENAELRKRISELEIESV